MKYFWQFSTVAIVCFMLTGCAARYTQPSRYTHTFDYVPKAEAPPGSADVTFGIVEATFVAPVVHQQAGLLPENIALPSAPPPLFQELVNNMTKDFEEVLTARGFTLQGSYRTLDSMIYPDKEGSDLILTAKVRFSADTRGIRYEGNRWLSPCLGVGGSSLALTALGSAAATPKASDGALLTLLAGGLFAGGVIGSWQSLGYTPSGEVQIGCEIELEAYEALTGEVMWVKKIPISSFTVTPKARVKNDPGVITWQQLMEIDNRFYSDIGRAFETQYDEILNQIYVYLHPKEMAIVKNQAMELRKRKVY